MAAIPKTGQKAPLPPPTKQDLATLRKKVLSQRNDEHDRAGFEYLFKKAQKNDGVVDMNEAIGIVAAAKEFGYSHGALDAINHHLLHPQPLPGHKDEFTPDARQGLSRAVVVMDRNRLMLDIQDLQAMLADKKTTPEQRKAIDAVLPQMMEALKSSGG